MSRVITDGITDGKPVGNDGMIVIFVATLCELPVMPSVLNHRRLVSVGNPSVNVAKSRNFFATLC
jgi:hypothetical protein